MTGENFVGLNMKLNPSHVEMSLHSDVSFQQFWNQLNVTIMENRVKRGLFFSTVM
jgi:hypothetical protein